MAKKKSMKVLPDKKGLQTQNHVTKKPSFKEIPQKMKHFQYGLKFEVSPLDEDSGQSPPRNGEKSEALSSNVRTPSTGMQVKEFVLNPSVNSRVTNFKNSWKKGRNLSDDICELDHLPFKHCVIKKLLKDTSLLDTLCDELLELPYEQMSNDLYSFHQTNSLFGLCDSAPVVERILDLIKGPLRTWVQNVTGKEFSDKVTATASQYKFTDRLLCHDDNLADRSVAFIFYLCKDWSENCGGALDLFSVDSEKQPYQVVKHVSPSFGSFAFFEVTQNSYHQVAEVLSSKCVRLSINGWYHGKDLPQQVPWHAPLPKMLTPIQPRGCSVERWINPTWLDEETNAEVQKSFHKELSIALPKFLNPSVFEDIQKSLKKGDIVWEHCGPANRRRFEVARPSTLPIIVQDFLQFIQSKYWFRVLSEYTVDIDPDMKPKPKCWFEVQRWQAGNYTMLVDNDPANNYTGMDVHLYFGVAEQRENDQGGDVHYLGPERDETGCLESAGQIEPQNNQATIITHIEGMAVLTKYLDHRNTSPFYKILAHYSHSLE